MEDYPLNQIIDQYLQGTISSEDKKMLLTKIDSDPQVAKLVEESQLAYKAIEAHRRKELKTKLQTLDKNAVSRRKKIPGWLSILILLLGAGAIYLYMSLVHFSPQSIARNHFVSYKEVNHKTMASAELPASWTQAEEFFNEGAYREAIQYFAIIAEHEDSQIAEVARWNITVAQFALEGTSPHILLALEGFEKSESRAVSEKAGKLKECLESGAYRFFFLRLQDSVTTIKPRLI